MHNYCVRIILLSGCMSGMFYETMLTDTSAGSRQQKDQSSASAEPTDRLKKPLPSPTPKNPIRQRTEQIPARAKAQENPSVTLQRPAKEGAIDAQKKVRQGHRQGKESKKAKAQAVIKPRTDLMYHGILEDPSRYDPRQNRQTAGAPDPQTPELTHDHFQELDRNRDGKIDPVERAFGRLDMDRDLSTRQWQ
jgi:hypothetical protein